MYSFSENSGGKLPEQEALDFQFLLAEMLVTVSMISPKLLILCV